MIGLFIWEEMRNFYKIIRIPLIFLLVLQLKIYD